MPKVQRLAWTMAENLEVDATTSTWIEGVERQVQGWKDGSVLFPEMTDEEQRGAEYQVEVADNPQPQKVTTRATPVQKDSSQGLDSSGTLKT